MILNYLREQTRKAHQEVEQIGYGKFILNHSIEFEDYTHFLYQNYIAYKTIEDALILKKNVVRKKLKPFITNLKSNTLKKDIAELNPGLLLANQKPYPFSINTEAEAIGALYVIEGSMLGSMLLFRNIAHCKKLKSIKQHYFYDKNQKQVIKDWQTFCFHLNTINYSNNDLKLARIAAENSFTIFGYCSQNIKPKKEVILK